MNATISQNDAILSLLRARWPDGLSAVDAFEKIGCMRLAARIHDLREMGHDIRTEYRSRNGKTWAVYKISGLEATDD